MDNIPMVPAGACLCQLCRSRGAEYQSPYFFFSRCFCCQAYYNHYNDAEQEHPSAEEQPVHIIEQIFECTASYISCITVIYFLLPDVSNRLPYQRSIPTYHLVQKYVSSRYPTGRLRRYPVPIQTVRLASKCKVHHLRYA